MSLKATFKALPTLLRIGFSEAIAYRAELFIWVLSTTMPFINLALWSAVAHAGPLIADSGRQYDEKTFAAYFLATFIVRQLTGAWAAWEMNMDVKSGKLSMRLLRPVSPLWSYAASNAAALPMRFIVALPVAVLMVVLLGSDVLPHTFVQAVLAAVAMFGGWLITLLANLVVGSLSLLMESSLKVMDVWLSVYFVFSGYIVPVELFPPTIRAISEFLPFRYQVGVPTEILTGMYTPAQALPLLGYQFAWVIGLTLLLSLVWRTGVKRFAAFGG